MSACQIFAFTWTCSIQTAVKVNVSRVLVSALGRRFEVNQVFLASKNNELKNDETRTISVSRRLASILRSWSSRSTNYDNESCLCNISPIARFARFQNSLFASKNAPFRDVKFRSSRVPRTRVTKLEKKDRERRLVDHEDRDQFRDREALFCFSPKWQNNKRA